MKEKFLAELLEILRDLDENQLHYVLTFVKRLFGGI